VAPAMRAAIFSALHLLALGIGLGSVWMRGRSLSVSTFDRAAIRRVLAADSFWGLAAVLWVATGLTRVLGELDKTLDFYVYNGFFRLKMGLFLLLVALEIWPMATFIRWRIAVRRGASPDTSRVLALRRVNAIEVLLVVAIVFVAAMMARGLWLVP
jgi:putative membrane protein